MNAEKHFPKTLIEVIRHFSDLNVAHDFFANMRWPNGPVCPRCGSRDVKYLAKYRRFQCSHNHKGRQFTVKTGTVMEDSPLPLDKWIACIWLEVNCKNSVSSYEIARDLGVTQKSAWFMLHRVRHALHVGSFDTKLQGVVEADETFVGGLAKFMHKGRRRRVIKATGGGSNKTIIMGLLERHTGKKASQVRATVLPNVQRESLHAVIHKNVEPGSHIYTDAWRAYSELGAAFFHDFVDHAESYVKGAVHTNGLENFWALFKRCIKGTHISIEPFHLAAYVDSEAFRFNNREVKDADRFALAVRGLHGKRLTYKALTGALELSPGNGRDAGSANPAN